MKLFGLEISRARKKDKIKITSVDDLNPKSYQGQNSISSWDYSINDGGKFPGGFGPTQIFNTDYWTLRKRSVQLFTENLYAWGLINRLVTNEINTGLVPEMSPESHTLGIDETILNEWSEIAENRFTFWCKTPSLCDYNGKNTFGALERAARMEALIAGDVLVVLHQDKITNLPKVQLISGEKVRTPFGGEGDVKSLRKGHQIKWGVEVDPKGLEVAYWVTTDDGGTTRVPTTGLRSKRKVAWLIFGVAKRLGDLRGRPLLSLVLQSLKEIDRYRDSVQRKAVINSILAMFIRKTEDKAGTMPVSGGAVRKDKITVPGGNDDAEPRTYNIASQIPGLVMEELQVGEEPIGFNSTGVDVNFKSFEDAILRSIAWANEIPPEILFLAFQNNYSASQAAINEFKIYLNKIWVHIGETFCTPICTEWLLSETLSGKIQAPGLLESWRDPMQYDIFAAWTKMDWYGSIKPSTDMLKQARGSKILTQEGWSTNARESRATTGTNFVANIKRLKRENLLKVEALRPLAEFQREFGYIPDAIVEQRDEIDEIPVETNGKEDI